MENKAILEEHNGKKEKTFDRYLMRGTEGEEAVKI